MEKLFSTQNPFMKRIDRIFDYFILNLCFILTCVPIITIGCSVLTLYRVIGQQSKDGSSSMVRLYFSQFRKFLKIGLLWFISFSGVTVTCYLSLIISMQMASLSGVIVRIFDIFALITMTGYFEISSIYFSRYNDKFAVGVKNSISILYRSPVGFALVICLFLLYQSVFLPSGILVGLYFLPFGGVVLLSFVKYKLFLPIINKFE